MAKQEIVKKVTAVQTQSYKGPIPQPEMLAQYEQICPGFADRIMSLAEREAASRQMLEKKNLEIAEKDVKDARSETERGQWLSFVITITAFATAVICAYLKQPWVGSIIGGTTLISVISIIMRKNENDRK